MYKKKNLGLTMLAMICLDTSIIASTHPMKISSEIVTVAMQHRTRKLFSMIFVFCNMV